ncbi:MAG: ABC transporter permease [Bacillota bacterium]|nr:ABC transporter permease [Bacillota bacterium]
MADIAKDKKKTSVKSLLTKNVVTLIFIFLTVAGIMLSELPVFYLVNEMMTRITRNTFLVLSLIIPITAGIGLNFGIIVGAMAGQIALIIALYFGWTGLGGLLLACVVATPIAIFFGYLTGVLFNNTKGQEMIAGLIVGFFANGLYQFLLLIVVGGIVPIRKVPMLKPDGVGLRNTIALDTNFGEVGLKYAFDNVFKVNLFHFFIIIGGVIILYSLFRLFYSGKNQKIQRLKSKKTYIFYMILGGILIGFSYIIIYSSTGGFLFTGTNSSAVQSLSMLQAIEVPIFTLFLVFLIAVFNIVIMKTKLGQDFKSIGLSQHIARVSGINVDRTRIIAVIMSTVLAAWGQIIFLQNVGTINTYGSHMQVGLFAVAAILIGGATVKNATIGHGILGIILFHAVFIVSPTAGKQLFGDAQLGEYFRAFIVYGVIGVSLALHAWKNRRGLEELGK